MTSKIKVDNINKVSDDSNIINKCGTAINVGASGNTVTVTGNDIRSDSYKAADGGVIASQSGTTITLGASGDTIQLASGASQSGFGRTGTVDWQTGSIKTGTFTAANGEGYFADTSSGGFTMNLPAGSAGAIVAVSDYASTFNSNNLQIEPNGSEKINGTADGYTANTDGISLTFVYVDSTRGWINVNDGTTAASGGTSHVVATGGTVTTTGDYKIHTFTGPGTFCVTGAGTAPNNVVDYLVVAGAGGAGSDNAGGGGAGGYRESNGTASGSYTVSPLATTPTTVPAISVSVQGYPIQVGGGGTGGGLPSAPGGTGTPSIFSTVTSAGGGGGNGDANQLPLNPGPAANGGSGGGGSFGSNAPVRVGGSGNTPPVTPPQGTGGGDGNSSSRGGGGGGATGGGDDGGPGGAGGCSATSAINATPTGRAGGGAGGPSSAHTGASGSANTGNGGAGPGPGGATVGGAGGSGVVIIRYKYQN